MSAETGIPNKGFHRYTLPAKTLLRIQHVKQTTRPVTEQVWNWQ
jgi:hypothetical protein